MIKKLIVILHFTFYILNSNCYAEPISSTELIEHAKEYNNKEVEYQGEAVGDVMVRGDYAWVNINDGRSAIGVWGPKDMINNAVNYKGNYNCKGDIVSIKGAFHRACPEHGGDLDIHIYQMTKIEEGSLIQHPVHFSKIAVAFSLAVLTLVLLILSAIRARRG